MNTLTPYILQHVPTLAIMDMSWDKKVLQKQLSEITLTIGQLNNYIITTHRIERPEEWK